MVDFSIEIEPEKGLSDEQMKKEFPDSVVWLSEVDICPNCNGTIFEV
jgi:hypothetical protein